MRVIITHGLGSGAESMRTLLPLHGAEYIDAPSWPTKLAPANLVVRHKAWVSELTQAAAGEEAVFIGHSWGGAVALHAASLHPHSRAILICPTSLPSGTKKAAHTVGARTTVISGTHDLLTRTGPDKIAAWAGCEHVRIPGLTHAGFLRSPVSRHKLEHTLSKTPITRHVQRHLLRDAVHAAIEHARGQTTPINA